MSEENQLSTIGNTNDILALMQEGGDGKYATPDALKEVSGSGLRYLPYIQVANSTSQPVMQRKTGIGTLYLTQNKEVISLGETFIALILAWRPKAMQYAPTPMSFFDTTSEAYKAIERTADIPNSGKAFGPEFLLWLPEREQFVTFFYGNKTARNESPNVIAALKSGKIALRFETRLITDKKTNRSWYTSVSNPYTEPVLNMPPRDTLMTVLENFKNPPETDASVPEKAEEGTRD